jgi:hypothetical protein
MTKEGCYTSRDFVGLRGALKNDHTNLQALFRRYLASRAEGRPAIVQEILVRLQAHLDMEENVLFAAIRAAGSHGFNLVANAIFEYDDIQSMFCALLQATTDDEEVWEKRFEEMMWTANVHFITEERDLLPLVDRSRDV